MPDQLTHAERDAIRERLEAATPGEWSVDYDDDADDGTIPVVTRFVVGVIAESAPVVDLHGIANADDNAAFIAHAPTDVRRLLDEVERLEAQCDTLARENLRLAVELNEATGGVAELEKGTDDAH